MTNRIVGVFLVVALSVFGFAQGVALADITDTEGSNVQEGDNSAAINNSGSAGSGDAVGGQVAGIVSSGDTSVDGRNRSEDVDVSTGAANGLNSSSNVVGLSSTSDGTDVDAFGTDISESCDVECDNVQEGDNDLEVTQTTAVTTGDGVGGQVIGAVTSAGGSTDIVAANDSEDVDVDTGDAFGNSVQAAFVGLNWVADIEGDANVGATDIDDVCSVTFCPNLQEGDNEQTVDQATTSSSGDGVGGQVIGAVSAGDTSIDARNRSEDADISTGEGEADSESASVTGLAAAPTSTVSAADITESCDGDACNNLQEGDNTSSISQAASSSSGDGVGGQVIGAVTSAGGSADIVAANESEDVDVDTGDADADSTAAAQTGLLTSIRSTITALASASDIDESCDGTFGCVNAQEGDNDTTIAQTADSASGDGVAGQVIGAVSAGDTSIDARNRSEDVGIDTGDADADNSSASFTGLLAAASSSAVIASDVTDSCDGGFGCINVQEGDNSTDLSQDASASSGDGVGGQVVGAVTSAGGSADIVAANESEDVDISTGNAVADSNSGTFVGLSATSANAVAGDPDGVALADIEGSCDGGRGCINVQEGDNELAGDQSAAAATGDGVAGQVIGAVSAGDTSIDGRNRSEDVDLDTGDSFAFNDASVYVGLGAASTTRVGPGAADIEDAAGVNIQEGDNDKTFSQSSVASSGDAVGGQVAGVVTSAGGSADMVLDNTSEDVDAGSGDNTFDNDLVEFVGLHFSTGSFVL